MHRPNGLSASLKVILAFAFLTCFGRASQAQIIEVKNANVAGQVEAGTGILTVKDVIAGKSKNFLTNPGHSYLSLSVNGQWYTNNNVGGQNLVGSFLGDAGSAVTPIPLDGGITNTIADTIQTVFHEGSGAFDIVQEVYPVQFRASGQIVLRVKIVNHSASQVSVEGLQWLNDVQAGTDDNPFILERNYYDGNRWRVAPKDGSNPNPPSFYIEFEHDPTSLNLGLIGAGFTNDSFPPEPMGLTPCTGFAATSWQGAANYQSFSYVYGCPAPPSPPTTSDMSCVLQWKPVSVPAGTTVEEFRTSFGTQEFCMCLGNAISVNLFPTHLKYDQITRKYTPNAFQAVSMMFNIQGNALSNVTATHSTGGTIHIVKTQAGGSIAIGSQSSTYTGATISPGQMRDFLWVDSTYDNINCNGAGGYSGMDFNITASGLSPPAWECTQPGNHNGNYCDVLVDCADVDLNPPAHSSHSAVVPAGGGSFVDTTFVVNDKRATDFGMANIKYFKVAKDQSSPQDTATFKVTVNPALPVAPGCPKTDFTIDVRQMDSTKGGYVWFQFTDCANNVSRDTVWLKVHAPALLPDSVAPKFYNRGYSKQNSPLQLDSGCTSLTNYRHSDWVAIDTAVLWHDPKFPHGMKSILPVGAVNNMKLTVDPFGAAKDSVTFHIDVIDTMHDGNICVEATDTAGNRDTICFHYCTVPDTTRPYIAPPVQTGLHARSVHVTDSIAWDRGLDSVYLYNGTNVRGVPSDLALLHCQRDTGFTFFVEAIDPNSLSCFQVRAVDCAGNVSTSGVICMGQDTDVNCPKIEVTPVDFTHIHVVVRDSSDTYEQGVDSVWFTGVTNMKLVRIDPPGAQESHCPGDATTTFNAIHGTPSGLSRPKFQRSVQFDLEICDTSNIDVNQACVTINAVDGAHDANTDGHKLCTGAYQWCQPLTVDSLPPQILSANANCSSIDIIASDYRINDRGLSEFKLSNAVNLMPFDLNGLAGDELGSKKMTLNLRTKGKSAYGTLYALDAFGAKQTDQTIRDAHTATGTFWLYAQDLEMKAGHVFLDSGTYTVPIVLDKSDSIQKLSQKKLWQLQFAFHLEGDPNITFVTAQPGSFAPNWNVSVSSPSPLNYVVTATGAPLPDWTTKEDVLLSLVFHANRSPNTGATKIVVDPVACGSDSYVVSYNGGVDTGAAFSNATITMHAPIGNLNGGVLTIKGDCSPFVSENGAPPTAISLAPIKPNPAFPGTPSLHLMYTLAEEGVVKLGLYNVLGERVRTIVSETQKQGEYQLDVLSSDLPQGMYFLRLETGGETLTRRVVLGGD